MGGYNVCTISFEISGWPRGGGALIEVGPFRHEPVPVVLGHPSLNVGFGFRPNFCKWVFASDGAVVLPA